MNYRKIEVQSLETPTGRQDIVGLNYNVEPTAKVQAFVTCFAAAAARAQQLCGLPQKLILAQWGAESGWGTSKDAQKNQNYAAICVPQKDSAEQLRCFEDTGAFVAWYAKIFNEGAGHAVLRRYLESTTAPEIGRCIDLIAHSDYAATAPAVYARLLRDCVASIEKRTDFK